MKTIANRTPRPIKIALKGGHFLHLGPGMTGRIADDAARAPAVLRLVAQGEVEIVEDNVSGTLSSAGPRAPHESVHGHHPATTVKHRGNR